MTDIDLTYLCAGFGTGLLLYWLRQGAYCVFYLFNEKEMS